jgi:hypothetical protein
MQGVPYPVLGIGKDGQQIMMQPGEEYTFNKGPVTEIPMRAYGGPLVDYYKGKMTGPNIFAYGGSVNPRQPLSLDAVIKQNRRDRDSNLYSGGISKFAEGGQANRYYYNKGYGVPMFQDGAEYKGPSIVDYLATKGYSGKKSFRKELAEKYGVEDYDFSAKKNLELLSKLRENDDLLEDIKPSFTPVSVEKMEEVEKKPRAVSNTPKSLPNKRPKPKVVIQPNQVPVAPVVPSPAVIASPSGRDSGFRGMNMDMQNPAPVPQQVAGLPFRINMPSPAPVQGFNFAQHPTQETIKASVPIGIPVFNTQTPIVKKVPIAKTNPPSSQLQRSLKPTSQIDRVLSNNMFANNWNKPGAARQKPIVIQEPSFFDNLIEIGKGIYSGASRLIDKYKDEDEKSIKKIETPIFKTPTKTSVLPGKKDNTSDIEFGYKELYSVPDVKHKDDLLVSFTNTFNNDTGARYYVGHKAKEVTDAGAKKKFTNVQAVAHFLRDSDILPGQKITPTTWNTVKGYTYHTTSPGKTVSATGLNDPDKYRTLYKKDFSRKDDSYLFKYIKNKEITPALEKQLKSEGWQLDFMVNGQAKFSDVAWDKEGPSTGYAAKSRWVPTKTGSYISLPYKDKNAFSRFSGGSVTYLFRDPKTNQKIGVDISGSVNTIRKGGEELIKKYKLNPNDLEFIYHDMGSYSAKPKAKSDGTLDYDQWLDYNNYNKGFSGAPLMIPKNKYGGDISIPQLPKKGGPLLQYYYDNL